MGNLSQNDWTSPATWDHTVLPATRHKWMHPALTPASKLVLNLPSYPRKMEGWVDLPGNACTTWEPNSRSLARSQVHKSDASTTTPPNHHIPWYLSAIQLTIAEMEISQCMGHGSMGDCQTHSLLGSVAKPRGRKRILVHAFWAWEKQIS